MAAPGGKRKRGGGTGRREGRFVLVVSSDQRQCLVEDVAHFRAGRHRPAAPGSYRKDDLAEARAEIESVFRRYQKRRGGST